MNTATYSSGQVASAAGITRKALRVYEERGLLSAPERTPAGYRIYAAADIDMLRFIRQGRTLGLSLNDIGAVLRLRQAGEQPCATVRGLLDEQIAEIDAAIGDLRALRATLTQARSMGNTETEALTMCPIIERAS